jgi:DNA repair protein RadB
MIRMIPTGCGSLDKLLDGGLHPGDVTLVYGEAETGKTSLAIQCAVNAVRLGCKVIFVDSDGTFSPNRLAQIAGHDLNEVAPQIILIKPTTFQEQALAIDRLDAYLTPQICLVIVDTVTSLYRAELNESKEETFKLNRELGSQLADVAQLARTRKIAVFITSQVRNVFVQDFAFVEPVGTRVLLFWSDTVLSLRPADRRSMVKAVLEKHSGKAGRLNCYFSIEENGICDCH